MFGCIGTAIDAQVAATYRDVDRSLLEVGEAGVSGGDVLWYVWVRKTRVVVSSYEEFVTMGLRFEPGQDVVEFPPCSRVGKIPGMNKNIAFW